MSSAYRIDLQADDKVLFVQLRAMGDTLLLTPLIRSLKQYYPEVHIDILVEPLPAQVLENNPNIQKVHSAPRRGSGLRKYFSLLRMLRNQEFALAIDFLSTPGSALLTRLTGAENRIGYRLRGRSWAYTHPVDRRIEPIYNPLTKFDLVRELDIKPDSLKLDIFTDGEAESFAETAWSKFGFDESTTVYALAPWSKRAWRRWEIGAWLEVIRRISLDNDARWLLFAAEG
ncbi:MAG TPA: lipopolysaccharide heptosyltransferase family protein, partial [Bacteroidetes bacterium]|nr:lipopolysaccharide heptosyltransferase family protein [Bacteroidota bacterium]